MSAKNTVLAFMVGAAVGAALGVLFAPEKGEVTRRRIRRAVEDGKDRMVDAFESGRDAVVNAYHRERDMLVDAYDHGREMVEQKMEAVCEKATAKARKK